MNPQHSLYVRDTFPVWITGFILLHFWAVLCYFGIFSRMFLAGNKMLGREQNGQNEEQAQNGVYDANEMDSHNIWQGGNGIVSRVIHIFTSVIFYSEWDKVDRTVLLDESTVPLLCQLLLTLLGPSFLYFISLFPIHVLRKDLSGICCGHGTHEQHVSNLYNMMIYRIITTATIILQLVAAFQAELRSWFAAVHNAARDDRYLIGVTLLDYVPPLSTKS